MWGKIVDKAYDYLEKLLGENIAGLISVIILILFTIAVVIDMVRP